MFFLNSLPSTIDDRARYTLEEITANWKIPFRILYRFVPRSEFFLLPDLRILNVYLLLFQKSSLTLESFNI